MMHDILLPSSKTKRLHNSVRLPRQAALAARLPIIGRRVPMRDYWSHRPVRPRALLHEVRQRMRGMPMMPHVGARDALAATGPLALRAQARVSPAMGDAAVMARERVAQAAEMRRHVHIPEGIRERLSGRWLRVGAVVFASMAFMFYFDPISGRRRRAMVRDRVSHAAHTAGRVPSRLERRGRFARGVARGVVHGTKALFGADGHRGVVDEEMLVARVRSEVFRDLAVPAGAVNIDAYEGCVTLRGQLSSESEIRRLVSAAKGIDGVRSVRSYLHLPDELPPNKAEMYEHSEQHLPSM
jgi:hypothetical protein